MTIQAVKARNQFRGRIVEIVIGSAVSEVDVETPSDVAASVITTRSLHHLQLEVGSEVIAIVKSTDVALAKL